MATLCKCIGPAIKWILFIAILCANSYGQNEESIVVGKKIKIHSDVLDQNRVVFIHLPKSYNDTIYAQKYYPILVLLDAQEHFELVTGVVNFMSTRLDSKLIPEFIIVGIQSEDRFKDYTPSYSTTNPEGVYVQAFETSGGGDLFLKFLVDELVAKIDQDYRTQPYRILIGHSIGGTLVVYDQLSPNPHFNAYIAMDPSLWWDNGMLAKRVDSLTNDSMNNSIRKLYITGAHNSPTPIDNTPMRQHQEMFFEALRTKMENDSKASYKIYPDEDHGTVPLRSVYDGLQFIFENYKMKDMLSASAEEIQEHFIGVSNKVGIELRPEERVIDILGNYFLESTDQMERAIALFELNILNYPNSYHAYYSLAKAERKIGNIENAKAYYKRSIEQKPDNNVATDELNQLLIEEN